MSEKKVYYIPKTEYIDGMPEFMFVPVDVFVVFMLGLLIGIWGLPEFLRSGAFLIGAGFVYYYNRLKKKYSKNFYLTIPYRLGLKPPKGIPPVTVNEFME